VFVVIRLSALRTAAPQPGGSVALGAVVALLDLVQNEAIAATGDLTGVEAVVVVVVVAVVAGFFTFV
jgi:hypothetical protein